MLWDVAVKHMWRRKLRSILTILGVAVTIQLYLLVSGVSATYRQEIQSQLGVYAGKVVVEQQLEEYRGNSDFTSSGSSLSSEVADELLGLPGVDRTASSAIVYIPIARALLPYQPPAVLAVGIEPGRETAFLANITADAGTSSLTQPTDAILGQNAAAYFHPADSDRAAIVGDVVTVQGREFRVIGILQDAPQVFSNSVILPMTTVQDLFDRPGLVSSVILTAEESGEVPALQTEIESRYPGLSASTQEDLARQAAGILEGLDRFMRTVGNSVLAVAVIMLTIVVVVAVMEQRREIGTLRAVGAQRWRIFSMVAVESILLSVLGAMLALPIAFFLVRWGMMEMDSLTGILQVWVQTLLLAAAIGLAGAILPAWQALRVDPLEALRYE